MKRRFRDVKWYIEDNSEAICLISMAYSLAFFIIIFILWIINHPWLILITPLFIPVAYAWRCYYNEEMREEIADRYYEVKNNEKAEIRRLKKLLLAKSKMVNIDVL